MLLAIDPGCIDSAYAFVRLSDERPLHFGKVDNHALLAVVRDGFTGMLTGEQLRPDHMAIEKIGMGGMPAGQETFDTAMWVGRYVEAWDSRKANVATLIRRYDEKVLLCGTVRAKDKNIRQAIIDRYGGPSAIKRDGPLWRVAADVWSSLAVAITWIELRREAEDT